MCSIRKTYCRRAPMMLALAAASGLAGCWTSPKPVPEEHSTEPLVIDEAIQQRDWPRTEATFQAGGVDAGPTGFGYDPQTSGDGASRAALGPEWSNALLDTGAFIAQALVLPFRLVADGPFEDKNYRGAIYNPTYTAMPLLPPDESRAQETVSSSEPEVEALDQPAE